MRFTAIKKQSTVFPTDKNNFDQTVEVYAWARTQNSANWRRILKFTDRDGSDRMVAASSGQIRTSPLLCDFLEDHGFAVPVTEEARQRLAKSVFAAQRSRRLLLVERPGWHGGQFLLGTETFGVGAENLMIEDWPGPYLARVQQAGTLAEWEANVAGPCAKSSYLVFGLCLALAAPLLRLAQVDGGCVHFRGASNADVSIIGATAATVFGDIAGEGSYCQSWREMKAAATEIAEGHCDLPLILSDLTGLDSALENAAQKAADIVHSIMTGAAAQRRAPRRSGRGTDAVSQARVLVVSASDLSLAGNARIRSGARLANEVWIIDIPVPTRTTGIFDRLPSMPNRRRRELVTSLRKSSTAHCGMAGRAFVQQIAKVVSDDEVNFKADLDKRMRRFFERAGVATDDAYEVQFARRFALAYAAGTLAIDYNVVPWHEDLVKRSIRRCYWRALDRRSGPQEAIRAAADAVIRRLQRSNDIADLTRPTRPLDLKLARRAKALLLPHNDSSSLLAVRPEIFRSLVGPKVSAQNVAAELERRGYLIPRPNGRRTRQVRVPGLERRRDYYCLRGDLFEKDASDLG
jgi:putative DNA primase/helicase